MSFLKYLLFLLIFNQYINSYNLRKLCKTEKECKNLKKNLFYIIITILIILVLLIIIIIFYIKFFLKKKNNDSKTEKDLLKKNYLFQEIMPYYIYNKNNQNECVICLQKFIFNHSKICITPCKHIFHFYCLKKFILSTKNIECPLCKYNFNNDIKNINEKELKKIKIVPLNENDNPEKEYHIMDKLVLNINKIENNDNINTNIQIKSNQKTNNNTNNNDHIINTEIIKINKSEKNSENYIKNIEQNNPQIQQNEDESNTNLRN